MFNNETEPHDRDLYERETVDGGFSAGWGMHFPPKEACWVDSHCHLEETTGTDMETGLDIMRRLASAMNVSSVCLILPMGLAKHKSPDTRSLLAVMDTIQGDTLFKPLLYIPYDNPDLELLEEALKRGILGVKLHNGHLISEGGNHNVWNTEAWNALFEKLNTAGLPVLWHVTQRISASSYTGGGKETYWKDGWEKGVGYTNQILLDDFLKIVKSYPGISFIGAHQLHLGWDRLAPLLEDNQNLFIDTSVGCVVNEFDSLYPTDKEVIRDWFIRFQDRILFGTDTIVDKNLSEMDIRENYANHIRFIKQLQLPDEPLQKISHLNSMWLFNLE